MAQKIRKGDFVKVIAGSAKGKEGKILSICGDWVKVEGAKMVIKHIKPTRNDDKGRMDTFPGNIHKSNVQHCMNGEIIKVGFKTLDGKKFLICKKTGKEVRKV